MDSYELVILSGEGEKVYAQNLAIIVNYAGRTGYIFSIGKKNTLLEEGWVYVGDTIFHDLAVPYPEEGGGTLPGLTNDTFLVGAVREMQKTPHDWDNIPVREYNPRYDKDLTQYT
ncbi:MAG: hypothetical protein NT023_10815 [Armatimonadetes bacterium]|nr:hypothetical protein [Armatimonadota bacterium]